MVSEPKKDWGDYYKATRNLPPSPLLVKALAYVIKKNKAIDIGGGALKDTQYLLSQGFETTAIDQSPQMSEMAKSLQSDMLHFYVTKFIDFDFPAETFDIASSMYSLPFNLPKEFNTVFTNIKKSLVVSGIFVGNFFGTRDDWHTKSTMTFHARQQVQALFADMEVIFFQEKEFDGKTADGKPKHWHLFNVIARKKK
ncbi:MAG: methyltransferase domain-containing protein [Candidatus Andersenbacteria bacterium]